MTERTPIIPPEELEADQEDRAEEHRAQPTRRGHGPKIEEAVQALRRAGRMPANLRPVVRDRRIIEWLSTHGFAEDLPSPSALTRHFNNAT